MMFVLGVGSTVGLMSTITTNVKDYFPKIDIGNIAGVCTLSGFIIGLIYCTQGGLHAIGIVDHFTAESMVFLFATFELLGIVWVYGIQNICWDVEFMLGKKLSAYWRICWAVIMPIFMLGCCVFLFMNLTSPMNGEIPYADYAVITGWTLFGIIFSTLFLCVGWIYLKKFAGQQSSLMDFGKHLFKLNENWGPANDGTKQKWIAFKREKKQKQRLIIMNLTWYERIYYPLLGKYE
mgnify:CR=1 FL=1